MPNILIANIDAPTSQVRRTPAGAEADAGLLSSVRQMGVLLPVLVTQQGERYTLVAGFRRLRAATAAGHHVIPAEVTEKTDEAWTLAAQSAENMARLALPPVDTWRMMVQLQAQGYTLPAAATMLGLTERRTRQLAKLGELHPEVMAEIETGNMPDDHALAVIANATPEAQAIALGHPSAKANWGSRQGQVDWASLENLLSQNGRSVSRNHALFDAAEMPWDEDLFAEPGSPEQFTTRDTARFLELQTAALAAHVAAAKKADRLVLSKYDAKDHDVSLPKGWVRSYLRSELGERPPKGMTRFVAVITAGSRIGEVKIACATQAASAKPTPRTSAADDDTAPEPQGDVAGDTPTPPPAAPPPRSLTKDGHRILARRKTDALAAAVRDVVGPSTLMSLMLLALSSRTVKVTGKPGHYEYLDMTQYRPAVLDANGHLVIPDEIFDLFGQALSRLLQVPEPNGQPDPVPEWIGAAVNASEHLPRFDDTEFLATVPADELRQAADGIGLKLKKVSELRTQLVGKLPDWRPREAVFGAPGPLVVTRSTPDADVDA